MTVNTQPATERPDPRTFGLPMVEQAGLPTELRTLVSRVHTLIETVANTEADPDALAAAAAAVEEINDGLARAPRRQIGTMVRRELPDGDSEYGTITNIVAGDTNPAAPPLSLVPADGGGVRGEVTLDTVYQGPPGLVHGGWIAALLDQAVGTASFLATSPGLTAKLEVDYRRPTPLFNPLEITAEVERTERRKVYVNGRIRVNGEVTAEAKAIMVLVDIPR